MICKQCGKENAENAKFCMKCGKELDESKTVEVDNSLETEMPMQSESEYTDSSQQPSNMADNEQDSFSMPNVAENTKFVINKIKLLPKKVFVSGIAVIVILLLILLIFLGRGNTIDLNNYMVLETEGYNGYGTARIYVDWDAIKEKYSDKIDYTQNIKKEYGDFLTYGNAVDNIEYFVDVTVDKSTNLSNGDELTYAWEINKEIYETIDCKLKFKDGTYSVSGLEEVTQFEAFDNLSIEFNGVGPNGSVSVKYEGEELSADAFSCEPSSGLKNGDTVTVSISTDDVLNCIKNYGVSPKEQTKEYTVVGLQKYVSSIDEINNESIETLKQQAEDVYTAEIIGASGEGEEFTNFSYLGNCVLTNKSEASYMSSNNKVYLLYKFDVRNTYASKNKSFDETNTLYWYVCFEDVTVDEEGNVDIDITEYETPRNMVAINSNIGWFKSWYYDAYESYDELYKSVVSSNMSDYYVEENIDME